MIERELGIVYAESNHFQLQRRLEEIATQIGMSSAVDLFSLAQKQLPGDVRELILDVATNNETSFFRDPQTFTALELVVPEIRKLRPTSPVRFWSAAASTGQEAYSIAMTLGAMGVDHRILATDVSERVLARAKEGVYSQLEVQRGLPARRLVQDFVPIDGRTWAISEDIKRRVEFRRLNLLSSWAGVPTVDIAFVRNVLIYQTPASKERIVARVHDLLAPGGYLVLGASESLLGVDHRFRMENVAGAHLYRKAIG